MAGCMLHGHPPSPPLRAPPPPLRAGVGGERPAIHRQLGRGQAALLHHEGSQSRRLRLVRSPPAEPRSPLAPPPPPPSPPPPHPLLCSLPSRDAPTVPQLQGRRVKMLRSLASRRRNHSCTAVHPHPPPSTPHCAFSVTSVSACSRKRSIHWISDKEPRPTRIRNGSVR